MQDCRVDYLAVAVADEGAELRKAGISTGIIVMNPEPSSFRTLFENKLEPEVYSFNMLRQLTQAALREGITELGSALRIEETRETLKDLEAQIKAEDAVFAEFRKDGKTLFVRFLA